MAQITAVEWLWRWIMDNPFGSFDDGVKAYNQAKAMEKQQIIEAAADHCYPTYELAKIDAEEYYNKTFKSE